MREFELALSRFPKETHIPLVRPSNRLSDEVINEYAGISNGRAGLPKELADDMSTALLEPWAVLTKNKDGRKSIAFVYSSSPNEQSGLIEVLGVTIKDGNFTGLNKIVDPKKLDTESTGITMDMITAAEYADKAMWARLKDGKNRSARFQKELERKKESGEQQPAYGKTPPGWYEMMEEIEREDGESSK